MRAASVALGDLREEPALALDLAGKDITKFRIITRADMGRARKTGSRTQGFVDSVLEVITTHFGDVLQDLTPWVPKAPKLKRRPTAEEPPEGPAPSSMPQAPGATTNVDSGSMPVKPTEPSWAAGTASPNTPASGGSSSSAWRTERL